MDKREEERKTIRNDPQWIDILESHRPRLLVWILTFFSWFDIKLLLYFYDDRDYKYIHIYIHTQRTSIYNFLSILATLSFYIDLPDMFEVYIIPGKYGYNIDCCNYGDAWERCWQIDRTNR